MNIKATILPSLLRLFDISMILITGSLAFYQVDYFKVEALDFQRYLSLMLMAAIIYILVGKKTYISWRATGLFNYFGQLITSLLTTWIFLLVWLVLSKTNDYYSRAWLVLWALEFLILAFGFRAVVYRYLRKWRSQGVNLRHVAIIGNGVVARDLIKRIEQADWTGYRVTHHITNPTIDNLEAISKERLDEIWLAFAMSDETLARQVMQGLKHSLAIIRFVPDWFSFRLINHGVSEILGIQMVNLYGAPMTGGNFIIKYIEDKVLGICFLILLSPLMLLIALGVKLNSAGPVLYRQERVGWNGAIFEILKFRTMPIDVEKAGVRWGGSHSKTVDKFSQFLRSTSLDELPQLFNVLKGEMSIVGPRPERPKFVEVFKEEIPDYMKKHLVKAGITGWAQIHGWRGDTDLAARIEHDLYYIENWSLLLDLKIILFTAFRGLVHKNAY